ncbi:hypothetical protein PRIPAC_88935 [Pristionchus pacificus]|uniref:Uncharacterized protein n=1 Tax=Pristionchus pacificus TaxID=54126 RepID=A0A2A6B6J0_PRIPA|nr:hypothetical protein PRIPAC_88935 [Pristionchus pacificus]|eukprot:PDM61497.1 hypothetical protein PRIPAC_50939 [Pristionchus pacificus]
MGDEAREAFFDGNDVRYFHALCCSAHVTALCIVINSVEIGIWILELVLHNPVDLRLMERSIVFIEAPEYFNNKRYEIKDEPVYAPRPTVAAADKMWVLLFISILCAALTVSIYFFTVK